MLGKISLHPSRRMAGFGQQTSGNEAVVGGNLSENNILRQHVVTEGGGRGQSGNHFVSGNDRLNSETLNSQF